MKTPKIKPVRAGGLTQRLNQPDHLRKVWKTLIAKDDDWRLTEIDLAPNEQLDPGLVANVPILRDELVIESDGKYILGPVAKHVLLHEFLRDKAADPGSKRLSRQEFVKRAYDLGVAANGLLPGPKVPNFRNLADRMNLSLKDGYRSKPEWPLIEDGFAEMLNAHHDVQDLYKAEDLFRDHTRFIGRHAPTEFMRFIQRQDAKNLEASLKFVAKSRQRQEDLAGLVNDVQSDAVGRSKTPRPMLLNVHSPGAWRDLAAMAQNLAVELTQSDIPPEQRKTVLRFPLARYTQSERQNPGRTGSEYCHTIDHETLLRDLARDFSLTGDGTGETPDSDVNAATIIRLIRQKLAEKAHVLIFEGYYETAALGKGREMLRIVHDDQLMNLLMRLLEAPIADFQHPAMKNNDGPLDIDVFRRSRIVVFSNRPLSYFEEDKTEISSDIFKVRLLTPPNASEVSEILELSELSNRDTLRVAFSEGKTAISKIRYEPVFDLLSAHLDLLAAESAQYEVLDPSEKSEQLERLLQSVFDAPDFPSGSDDMTILRWLMKRHLSAMRVRSKPLFQLHVFLALVPCGLKHTTLSRIARRMRSLSVTFDNEPQSIPFSSLINEDALNNLPETVIAEAGSLLTDTHTDVFTGFDNAPPVFETIILPGSETRKNTGYDFEDPMMKEAAAAVVIELDAVNTTDIAVLHRMLSDEALCQQTVSLVHRGADYLKSIRAFRRQMSGVLHGLLSLPLVQSGQTVKLDDRLDIYSPFVAGPQGTTEYFEWIYFFIFRRMIERPPAWNLSRHYALDRLKLDILEASDQPWTIVGSSQGVTSTSSLFMTLYAQTQPKLYEDHAINKTHAFTALSQIERAEDLQIQREKSLPKDYKASNVFKLKRLKDSLDINLLKTDPLKTSWRRFWDAVKEVPTQGSDPLFTKKWLKKQLKDRADFFFAQFNEINARPADAYCDADFRNHAAAVWDSFQDETAVSNICDSLYRLSELTAIEADLLRSSVKLATLDLNDPGAQRKITELMAMAKGNPSPYQMFCEALALYDFAEALRLHVFARNPGGSQFFASAHAARAGIRTSLILEREARKKRFKQLADQPVIPNDMRLGYFSQKARRICERVAKHTFRYPRERASLMILESSIHRMMSETPDLGNTVEIGHRTEDFMVRERALGAAQHYLADAEGIVITLSRRNRVRMRLSLERAKLNCALATMESDCDARNRYLKLAEHDVEWLEKAASPPGLVPWKIIAALARQRLAETRGK